MNEKRREVSMRKPERKIQDKETIASLLQNAIVGRIATINRQGFPVIKPVNFIYLDHTIYIHSSFKGEKVADIGRKSLVCFELDEPIAYAPSTGPACMAGYFYRSVVIKGRASLLTDRGQKRVILERLMEKYQPEGGYGPISEEILGKTAVIAITIEEMTGKEKLK